MVILAAILINQLLTAGTPTPSASQPAVAVTTTPASQPAMTGSPVTGYLPLISVVVGAILTTLFGVIVTLLWKWKDAEIKRIEIGSEIKRIEAEKNGEIKLLAAQKDNDLIKKDNEISILQARISELERKHEDFRALTSIVPLEFIRETKPLLESTIEELKKQIQSISQEKDQVSEEKEKLRLELEERAASIEEDLRKLSNLEKHLVDRAENIHQASLWLKVNKKRLVQESCTLAFNKLSTQPRYQTNELQRKAPQFLADVQDYLMLIRECLSLGRPNLLDKSDIPPVIHPDFYVEAFKLIRDEKVSSELSNKDAAQEIEIYLDYLIRLLHSRYA